MPLLLAFVLIGFFIWLAENISTFAGVWSCPNQLGAWSAVHVGRVVVPVVHAGGDDLHHRGQPQAHQDQDPRAALRRCGACWSDHGPGHPCGWCVLQSFFSATPGAVTHNDRVRGQGIGFPIGPAAKGFADGHAPAHRASRRRPGTRQFVVLKAVCLQAKPPPRRPSPRHCLRPPLCGSGTLTRACCGPHSALRTAPVHPGDCGHRSSHRGSARRLPCSPRTHRATATNPGTVAHPQASHGPRPARDHDHACHDARNHV